MNWSYWADEEETANHILDNLDRYGDTAALMFETGRAIRRGRDKLIAMAHLAGLTQSEIAERLNLDQSMVSKVLTSQRRAALHNETHGGTVK